MKYTSRHESTQKTRYIFKLFHLNLPPHSMIPSSPHNPLQQLMHSSTPLHQPSSKNLNLTETKNVESETQSLKTVTRFPPIIKPKPEETPNIKQNCKDTHQSQTQGFNLTKKISEDNTNPAQKKQPLNPLKKKANQKGEKLLEVKPEILQRYRQYAEFTSLINLSNNLRITASEKPATPYSLYVGKGNNSGLIKTLFRNYRPWWQIQQNPDSPNINLYWFQLRQNQILESLKDNRKIEADFDNCQFYLEEEEKQPQSGTNAKEPIANERADSNKNHQTHSQIRSQSVTQKDIRSNFKIGLNKRSSSRTKGVTASNERVSPVSHNYRKQFKEQILEGEVSNGGKKKKIALANPKMWPMYNNYRKIFSQQEMRQLKKLGAIGEDSKVNCRLARSKMRCLENRSVYLKSHNHLANNWNLSNKKALFMNLKNYYDAQKINPFQFIPMTFHITDASDKEYLQFQEEYNRRTESIKEEEKAKKNQQFKHGFKAKKRNAWLVKPGENTNRGTGIEVVESLDEIKQILEKDKVDKQGRPRTHIIQEYIMPFLYQKRKFDIRSYIVVTSINGYQKGYWYQDGYIRTASKEFNMKNLNNKYIHLTNDAVQKYHEDYGKFEPANKLSFSDFQRYLDTVYNSNNEGNKLKFYSQAYPEMKKLATDSVRAVFTKMDPTKKQFSFEIFGLDFLIDDNFKVWLIEANTNPCLQLACPLLGRVIPLMLESAFKLVIDPLFPPPAIHDLMMHSKKLVLPQNLLENNKFELIFDEVEEGKELRNLLTNTPEVKIYDIDEEEEEEYDDNEGECKKIMVEDDPHHNHF